MPENILLTVPGLSMTEEYPINISLAIYVCTILGCIWLRNMCIFYPHIWGCIWLKNTIPGYMAGEYPTHMVWMEPGYIYVCRYSHWLNGRVCIYCDRSPHSVITIWPSVHAAGQWWNRGWGNYNNQTHIAGMKRGGVLGGGGGAGTRDSWHDRVLQGCTRLGEIRDMV